MSSTTGWWPRSEIGDRRCAAQRHGDAELIGKDVEGMADAGLPGSSKPVEVRPPHQHRAGAAYEGREDVGTAAYPRVQEDFDAVAHGVDDVRECVDRRRDVIELATAM